MLKTNLKCFYKDKRFLTTYFLEEHMTVLPPSVKKTETAIYFRLTF